MTLSVEAQLEIISRGAVQITPLESLKEKLASGRQLIVKLGCDPSRPDLHLGHAVVLKKMRQFQDLGHKVVLIIGDFTGMIGDPTGKSKTRPALTLEATRENGKSYVQQATLILDPDPAKLEIRYNSEWLEPMSFEDVIRLSAKYTVAQMMTREDFSNRYESGMPISLHELMYPLAQAYDSVAIKADVELGGTDQTFNLMVGRDIQKEYGLEPQVVLTTPLLVGLDGVEKMSKSLDNYIGISEAADVMFSKIMKVQDQQLEQYLTLFTDLDVPVTLALGAVAAHRVLARGLVADYHGADTVAAAEERYDSVAKGGLPKIEDTIEVPIDLSSSTSISILELAVNGGLAKSKSEARRLIQAGGLKLNGKTIIDEKMVFELQVEPAILQKGKNEFRAIPHIPWSYTYSPTTLEHNKPLPEINAENREIDFNDVFDLEVSPQNIKCENESILTLRVRKPRDNRIIFAIRTINDTKAKIFKIKVGSQTLKAKLIRVVRRDPEDFRLYFLIIRD